MKKVRLTDRGKRVFFQVLCGVLGAALAVLGALCLLMLAPSPKYFLRTEQRVPCFLADTNEQLDLDWARAQGKPEFWASIRSEFDRVIDQYHIPQGLTYTVFIGQDYGIEVRLLANYLLSSAGTNVCTDAEMKGIFYRLSHPIISRRSSARLVVDNGSSCGWCST